MSEWMKTPLNSRAGGGLANQLKRHLWLITVVTALFVMQVPFCALACFEPSEANSSAVPESSCHEKSSDSSPAGESNSHKDCGCDFAIQALLSQPIDANTTAPVDLVVSRRQQLEPTDSSSSRAPQVRQDSDLPPPDILLLKSTLII
jgi:hypothetical protein